MGDEEDGARSVQKIFPEAPKYYEWRHICMLPLITKGTEGETRDYLYKSLSEGNVWTLEKILSSRL